MLNITNIEFTKNTVATNEALLIKVSIEESFAIWSDLEGSTWNDINNKTWEELFVSWNNINNKTWSEINEKTWEDIKLRRFE
jgi:hypothetical protein